MSTPIEGVWACPFERVHAGLIVLQVKENVSKKLKHAVNKQSSNKLAKIMVEFIQKKVSDILFSNTQSLINNYYFTSKH